jgi:Flp pilus assembly protein TadD
MIKKSEQIFLPALLALFLFASGCTHGEAARNQASYHYQMGLSYLGENNITSALVELTEAEKHNPDDPELLNYLGLAYYRKNKFELAEQKYLRALALKPAYSEARNNLGVNYLEMKRWDDAIYNLKLVNDDVFFVEHQLAGINLGLAYLGKGDYPKSLALFRSLVSANPRDPRARLHLGKVYLAMEKVELAKLEFIKATELYRDYANAHYYLGMAHMKENNNQAAIASFREVLRIAPDSEIGQMSREYIDSLK